MSVKFRFLDGLFFDSFKDEQVNYSRKAIDFQKSDVSFNDFSKSFFIPATTVNNGIFKHYYKPEVINSFNPFAENKAEMWVNNELYSTGQITLLGIDLEDNTPKQYSIQFYSDTIDLKSALKDKGIDQLSWSFLNHSVSPNNVRNYLNGGASVPTTNLIYPMASTSNYWSWEGFSGIENVRQIKTGLDGVLNTEVRPCLPVSDIIDRIFEEAGFDFEVDFGLESYYTELYMWINNGTELTREDIQLSSVRSNRLNTQLITNTPTRIQYQDDVNDPLKMFNLINNICTIGSSITLDYILDLGFETDLTKGFSASSWRHVINGVPGIWYVISTGSIQRVVLPALTFGDEVYIECKTNNVDGEWSIGLAIFKLFNTTQTELDYFVAGSYMPTIKCMEFIRGILVTFNAIMYWDAENSKFIIKHREQWFNEGKKVDITEYIDTKKSKIKPPTFYKKYGFGWVEGKDFRNVEYKAVNNRVLGSSFFDTGMFTGDTYENKSPFTPSLWVEVVEKTASGTIITESYIASTQTIDKKYASTDSGVRLMYYNGSKAVNGTYEVLDYTGSTGGSNATYNYFSSFLESDNELNLAFNSEVSWEAVQPPQLDDSLYSRFYESYISKIYDAGVRRLNVSAYIPYNKLKSIQVNDTIVINNVEFFIDGFEVELTTNKATFDLINKI